MNKGYKDYFTMKFFLLSLVKDDTKSAAPIVERINCLWNLSHNGHITLDKLGRN